MSTNQRQYTRQRKIPKTWFEVKVLSVDDVIIYKTGNTKIIFTARQIDTDNVRQCAVWTWTGNKLEAGDKLQITGFVVNEVFIVKKMLRLERAKRE